MANRIKGITVEIGGDTTKLSKALQSVNGEIRNTQAQLKDVDKLLKIDPANTELLAQKQSMLGKAIEDTKDKLETLKTAAEQANDALAKGELSQTQYDALQREIIDTENALARLEKQADQSAVSLQKIGTAGTALQSIGGEVESIGKKLLPFSAALTGIGIAGIKVASDFENSMSSVKAITGASEEEFKKLKETAVDLGASTAFSSEEVADAMTEMAKAGWTTSQIIDGMAGVLNATAASGENLGSVSTIVADAITGFGLAAKDSSMVADLMTQAANSGTIGIMDLGESYKYIAPLAQSMNFSIQDVTTAISAMSMAGIKGSQAGTSLRTVLANLAKPSSTVADAMDELGINIADSDGSFKSLNEIIQIIRTSFADLSSDQKAYYATALAGKEGMSGLLSLLNLTQDEYDQLSASMRDCTGIASETALVMQDNLQSKVEQLGGALEALAIQLAEYVLPFITGLVENMTKAVEAFSNMNPFIQKTVLILGSIVAIAGPLLIFVGKIISAVGTIMTLVPKLSAAIAAVKTAFAGLNLTMLANPIFLVIAAIAALVAAFIYLWNNSEAFREFWIGLWEKIKAVSVEVCSFLKDFISDAFQAIRNTVASVMDTIKNVMSSIWNAIKNTVASVLDGIGSAVNTVFSNVKNAVSSTMTEIYDTIKGGFQKAMDYIAGLAASAVEWGRDFVMGLVNGIKSGIGAIGDAVGAVADKITSFLHFSVPDEGPLTEYEKWMPDFISGLAKGIENSRGMIERAVSNIAADMMIYPQVASYEMAAGRIQRAEQNGFESTGFVNAVKEAMGSVSQPKGDIVIPVYLGGTLLDEAVISAQQRTNLRSGGR